MILLPKPLQNLPNVSEFEPGIPASLGVLQIQTLLDVGASMKDVSFDHITCISIYLMSRFCGHDTIIYASEHYFQ
jgi:hypothetical protein